MTERSRQLLADLGMFFQVLRGSSTFLRDGYELNVTKADYNKAKSAYDELLAQARVLEEPNSEVWEGCARRVQMETSFDGSQHDTGKVT